ncbi:hypothetical protein BH11PLA2_BH11PLA2_01560 [soil metagenome]
MNNLRIGKPFGINTYVHWSFWLLPGFVLLSGLASGGMPMAVLDTAVILAIFGCVALHELGHALAARQYGVRTRDIVLYPIGGVARLERIPRKPSAEIAIALAGPAVNVAIVALLVALMTLDGYNVLQLSRYPSVLELFWTKVLWANVALAVFNLIPAFPMDGGRVLRALLATVTRREKATEIAATVGTGFAILFGVGAVPIVGWFSPMMFVLAVFLFLTGQAELRSVREEEEHRYWNNTSPGFFAQRESVPVAHRADGWEYDPQSKHWTYWLHGQPVRRFAAN